ncbi:hypothetical protein BDV28DRAFT_144574 [Aspergillus coremiiformis]|uniref:Uncharacterized protein n=1 Tax=Aspergillus coremiiformis TaxID=138285 RepID=A0A5N6YR35_9EURO|nr:hypothetical protein BDV28DRAFT_144574 [Aspergillus coremiiformis]
MYEEVDDRYKEKLQRMLEAQNMQINTQFQNNLLAALAMRPGLQHRRASMLGPRGPIDGVRKMSLDLSSLRNSVSQGMQSGMHPSPLTSPITVAGSQNYLISPPYDGNSQSPSSFHPTVGPLPSYLAHQSTSTWPAQMGPQPVRSPWTAGFHSGGDMNIPARQFRDRLGSAPVLPVHAIPSPAAYRTTPTQHSRNRSEPGQTPTQRMPSQTPSVENTPRVESIPSRMDSLPSDTLPTPDLCPTPSTPHSPSSTTRHSDWVFEALDNKESDCVSFSQPFMDQDFVDFQGFSFSLGSNPPMPSFENTVHHPETEWKPDELVQLDEWLVGA